MKLELDLGHSGRPASTEVTTWGEPGRAEGGAGCRTSRATRRSLTRHRSTPQLRRRRAPTGMNGGQRRERDRNEEGDSGELREAQKLTGKAQVGSERPDEVWRRENRPAATKLSPTNLDVQTETETASMISGARTRSLGATRTRTATRFDPAAWPRSGRPMSAGQRRSLRRSSLNF